MFEGIKNPEERERYERAFPSTASAVQLLLPWQMLDFLERNSEGRVRFSTFHILWLIADTLRATFGVDPSSFFSQDLTRKLVGGIDDWMPDLTRIANISCSMAFQRAVNIMGNQQDIDLRTFFRSQGELEKGVNPSQLLREAFQSELSIERSAGRNPLENLPSLG